jgi:O-antigen/teichoic acid export membrane protein
LTAFFDWVLRSRHIAGLAIAPAVGVLGAGVASVLYARLLGPAGRGELAWLVHVGYLFGLAVSPGYDRAWMLRPRNERFSLRILWNRWSLVAVLSSSVLAAWRHGWWGASLAVAMVLGNALFRFIRADDVRLAKSRRVVVWTTVSAAVLLGGSIYQFAAGVDLLFLAVLVYTLSVGVPALAAVALWSKTTPSTPVPDDSRPSLTGQERRLAYAALSQAGMLRLDRILLPLLASSYSLGIYVAAVTIAEVLAWPGNALSDSLARSDSPQPNERITGIRFFLVMITLTVPVAAIGWVAVPIVFGEAFRPASPLVPALAFGTCLLSTARYLGNRFIAENPGNSNWVVRSDVIGLLVSIVAGVPLMYQFGAWGAAAASITAYAAALATLVLSGRED